MFTAAGKSAAVSAAVYIEDVFSTYLYTGTGATQTITNNIDTSTKGGLVWIKSRSNTLGHRFTDTARGATLALASNNTNSEATDTTGLTSFGTTGFTIGADASYNTSAATFASWTFRKQAKFFDVVTYTGNGVAGRTVSHNLGSVPGCIIIKCRSTGGTNWPVYHRSLANTEYLLLNSANPKATGATYWNSTTATSTNFSLGTTLEVNGNGDTYVAYLFAHDAGGFGAAGTDNVISCGSFTYSAGTEVNLGYEPQWLVVKRTDIATAGNWYVVDVTRGWITDSNAFWVTANTTDGDASGALGIAPTATGFRVPTGYGTGSVYIYIAIRRGPMKTPTSGTSVFTPIQTGSGSTLSDSYASIGFPIDMTLRYQTGTDATAGYKNAVYTRLLGINSGTADTPTSTNNPNLLTHSTAATATTWYYSQTGSMGLDYGGSWSAPNYVLTHLHFRRAPGFFDVVCYTGTGSNTTQSHNLAVVPEMMIVKRRDSAAAWQVYANALANTEYLVLNTTAAKATGATRWNSTTPTSTVFSIGTDTTVNASAGTYVAYLFATVAGVSKVGSYTGTGALQTINCGFAAGARFVLIKRTDTTGDWWAYDSARGITSGNDPYLFLNDTAAQVTSTNYVDTASTGFQVTAAAPAGLNANGGTYIFLAIA